MKIAISIPDETFEKATERAHDLGMSRSEFFTRAAAHYLDELDAESVTHQIDAAVDALGVDDSAADAVAAGRRVLDTLNKTDLTEQVGQTPVALMREIDRSLRGSLGL